MWSVWARQCAHAGRTVSTPPLLSLLSRRQVSDAAMQRRVWPVSGFLADVSACRPGHCRHPITVISRSDSVGRTLCWRAKTTTTATYLAPAQLGRHSVQRLPALHSRATRAATMSSAAEPNAPRLGRLLGTGQNSALRSSTLPSSPSLSRPCSGLLAPPPPQAPPDIGTLREILNGRRRTYRSLPGSDALRAQWERGGLLAPLLSALRATFLPAGYPDSVHHSYLRFHAWLFVETFVAAAVSVLCNQAMLSTLGVGGGPGGAGGMGEAGAAVTGAASALTAVVSWILKDANGELAKIFFGRAFAQSFDSRPRSWKFIGECLGNVGSVLMICTALAPAHHFLLLASLGNACRAISWMVWSATHTFFAKNFAMQNNVGDVSAKADSQMVVSHLCGLGAGIGLITLNTSPGYLLLMFALLMPLHLAATQVCLRACEFEVLNQSKALVLLRAFVEHGAPLTPQEMRSRERWFGEWTAVQGAPLPRVRVGATVSYAFTSGTQLRRAMALFADEEYMLGVHPQDGRVAVVLRPSASSDDVLRALLHVARFEYEISRLGHGHARHSLDEQETCMRSSLEWTRKHIQVCVQQLEEAGWWMDSLNWEDGGARVELPRTGAPASVVE